MKPAFPAAVWAWLAFVGVASFLTWGTIRPTAFSGFPGGLSDGFPGGFGDFFGGLSIAVNAWSGNLTLAGLQLPNWLTVVAATCAVGTAYARSTGAQLSKALPSGLILYALVHVALFALIVLGSGRGTLGIGAILMFVALGGLWRALMNTSERSTPIDPAI